MIYRLLRWLRKFRAQPRDMRVPSPVQQDNDDDGVWDQWLKDFEQRDPSDD